MAAGRLLNALASNPVLQAGSCSTLLAGASCRSALFAQLRSVHAASQRLLIIQQFGSASMDINQPDQHRSNTQQDKARIQQHWQHHQQLQYRAGAPFTASQGKHHQSSSSSSNNYSSSHFATYRGVHTTSSSGSSSSSSSGKHIDPPERELPGLAARLHLPPVIVAAAASASCIIQQASAAAARQVHRIIKLVQQTSLLQAASLQLASIWQQHSTALTTLTAAAATAGVYQFTYSAAACFIDMAQPGAMHACAASSAAAVAGLGLYVRAGLVVDAERVYAIALRKVVQHAGLQEVMGAPLAGSPMRVQLVTRGSYFIQESLLPQRRAPRIHMLFPITGPLKSGVVSLQAKKVAGGKYAFKTLMVELPSKTLQGATGTAAASSAALQAAALQEGDSSSTAGTVAAAAAEHAEHPARVYIIGKAKRSSSSGGGGDSIAEPGSSSNSSGGAAAAAAVGVRSRLPTAQVLLEQLKQPLVFALQQNVVIYETEDELESELGHDAVAELDPEQITVWDRAKQGACVVVRSGVHWGAVAGCKAVQLARKTLQAVQQSSGAGSKAQQQQQQQGSRAADVQSGAAVTSNTESRSSSTA